MYGSRSHHILGSVPPSATSRVSSDWESSPPAAGVQKIYLRRENELRSVHYQTALLHGNQLGRGSALLTKAEALQTMASAYIDKRQAQYKRDQDNNVRHRSTFTAGDEVFIERP